MNLEVAMLFEVSFDVNDQIIVSRLHAPFDWTIIENMVPQLAHLTIEKGCHLILLDFREANMNLATFKIYLTPEKLANEFQKFNINIRTLKRALVLTKPDGDYRFLETVTLNQSQMLHLFFNESEARAWLLK